VLTWLALNAGPSPLGNPPPPLKIQSHRLVTGKGKEVELKGINWFGFNVSDEQMVHGAGCSSNTSSSVCRAHAQQQLHTVTVLTVMAGRHPRQQYWTGGVVVCLQQQQQQYRLPPEQTLRVQRQQRQLQQQQQQVLCVQASHSTFSCSLMKLLAASAAVCTCWCCRLLLLSAAAQNGKTMVDGLDAGNSTWVAADFATVVYRLKLLGFNAVRLPFSFSDLELPTQ